MKKAAKVKTSNTDLEMLIGINTMCGFCRGTFLKNEDILKGIDWGNIAGSFEPIQPNAMVNNIKSIKEPILPNLLFRKATLPITMQK